MEPNKLGIPTAILLAGFIVGGSFYLSQAKKQESIERQQAAKIEEDRRLANARMEQEHKEYIAKRKGECYSLYEKERDKWNNVKGNQYDDEKDVCLIRYKATDEWKGKNCDDFLPKSDTSESLRDRLLDRYFDCTSNTFTNKF